MSHCVYFIEQERKSRPLPVKIGYSANPEERLARLQTASPNTLRLAATIPCESEAEGRKLERTLHWLAEKKYRRISGEWFLICGSWRGLLEQAVKAARMDAKEMQIPQSKRQAKRAEMEILREAVARIG